MKYLYLTLFSLIFINCATPIKQTEQSNDEQNIYVLYNHKNELETTNSDRAWQEAAQKVMDKISYFELIANHTESSFNYIEKMDNTQDDGEDSGYKIDMTPEMDLYKNFAENYSMMAIETHEKFLLKDSLNIYNWKLKNESKQILGYEVKNAETVDQHGLKVHAWYAPKLPFKNGPIFYGGLPGLILELEIIDDLGKTTFTAEEIKTTHQAIEKPKKGKEMWLSEFLQMQEEQMKKMREMQGGGVDIN